MSDILNAGRTSEHMELSMILVHFMADMIIVHTLY